MHTYALDGFCYSELQRPFAETELGKFVALLPPLQGAWIAGGAVRRMVLDEPLGDDIDVFFKSEKAFWKFQYLLGCADHAHFIEKTERRAIFQLRDQSHTVKADLVNARYFDGPQAIFDDFDLTCCQFAIDGENLYVGEYAMLHAANRICVPANASKLATWPQHLVRCLKAGFKASPEALNILVKELERDPLALNRAPDYSGGPASG